MFVELHENTELSTKKQTNNLEEKMMREKAWECEWKDRMQRSNLFLEAYAKQNGAARMREIAEGETERTAAW